MAALERYFLSKGCKVAGYDRTPSELTDALAAEGVEITFTDDETTIPAGFRNPEMTLVVYTPAIPDDNRILTWFRQGGFEVVERATRKPPASPEPTERQPPPRWPPISWRPRE